MLQGELDVQLGYDRHAPKAVIPVVILAVKRLRERHWAMWYYQFHGIVMQLRAKADSQASAHERTD
jgi:hypothetical protein